MEIFVGLAIAHAAALLVVPSIPLIGVGLWWNANTIAHNFIHRPFYRSAAANGAFSAFLSLVLGIPQSLWRQRHLQHHAETTPGGHARPLVITRALVVETTMVLTMWGIIAAVSPRFFLLVYLPGWALGMTLCQLQGHFEHAGGTTSHYGRLYNWLFFNDGYHVEHHLRPAMDWRELPALASATEHSSRWPPVLRWLPKASVAAGLQPRGLSAGLKARGYVLPPHDGFHGRLERLVLRSLLLQRFVISRHERAFRKLLPALGPITCITIVGGGLFPRTAMILRRLLPDATLTIVDASAANLATARTLLGESSTNTRFVHREHTPGTRIDADLAIIPLAYSGDRRRIYNDPPATNVIVHDWIWSAHSTSARVSWFLLKRLNLVQR